MGDFARTLRTIRHLRSSQWYWRLRYRWETARPVAVPRVPSAIATRYDFPRELLDHPSGSVGDPTDDEQFVEHLERGHFVHLNEARDLGVDPVDWRLGPRATDRLWTITLHYHAWAWRLATIVHRESELGRRADRLLRRYLGDWITRCDLTAEGSRALAWSAYAVATRIGWWCRLYHLLGDEGRRSWGTLDRVFLECFWCQAAYLSRHLEKDLRANHLLRDAVGLAWAGRFFEGPLPQEWLQTATQLAVEQAREQVLPDGGHFERSPMYHVEVMEDFLLLGVLLENNDARAVMRDTWRRMAEFLAWVRHPDGQVPLLNDGGLNGAPTPAAMFAAGRELLGVDIDPQPRQGGRLFADFGLAVWHGKPWSVFFDVGPVGVDYQPGHAHADTLTFEASYNGRRVFVDPGTLRYDNDESRRYDRATASHNTVVIDETDSSEVWHVFRVGRRARPIDVEFEAADGRFRCAASHTGYDHLPGRPRHRRALELDQGGRLTVIDRFEGQGHHALSAGLLLAPEWTVQAVANGWELHYNGQRLGVSIETPQIVQMAIDETIYHPEYGLERPTQCLCWRGELEFPCDVIIRMMPHRSG